jgi:PmbA protein
MNLKEASEYTLTKLKELGANHSQVWASQTVYDELCFENNDFTQLRSIEDTSLSLKVIKDKKEGEFSLNKLEKKDIDQACEKVIAIANAGKEDDAFAIAPKAEKKVFRSGDEKADLDNMYKMISDFNQEKKEKFPKISLRNCDIRFNQQINYMLNSNGTEVETTKGFYGMVVLFNAQEKDKTSSLNYDSVSFRNFNKSAMQLGLIEKNLSETEEQLDTLKVPQKFTGKVILTPQCFSGFLGTLLEHLGTGKLISETSRFQEKIGKKVVSEMLTLKTMPHSELFAHPNFVTDDGIESKEMTIFENGVLKDYILGLYGKNKMKRDHVSNFFTRPYIKAGEQKLDELISQIDEGILVGRFSGGRPSTHGDLSGIAKNSFYIKDGKISHALSETMMSANLFDMFNSIWGISEEVYQNGTSHIPYIAVDNISIS